MSNIRHKILIILNHVEEMKLAADAVADIQTWLEGVTGGELVLDIDWIPAFANK